MKLYNSLTRSVDEFRSVEEGKVRMYTCGPTVYHFAHIGTETGRSVSFLQE